MTEEARRRIEELRKEKKGVLVRNYLLIFTSTATLLMALVLWSVLSRNDDAVNVYIEEAQETVKIACQAAEGQALPAEVRQSCEAAERNELPQELQSVVDNPDPDDPETQDTERQDPETQESEVQDPEQQDPEAQEPELSDSEANDPDPDDPEVQDEEIQEEEFQEPEIQDPEEQGSPVCPPGYSTREFRWFGRDGVDGTGDEQDWLLCVRD